MTRSKNVGMKAAYLAAGVLPVLLGGCSWGSKPAGPPVTVVPKVDLARYAGKWHEIAKYPNRCSSGDATARRRSTPSPPAGRASRS